MGFFQLGVGVDSGGVDWRGHQIGLLGWAIHSNCLGPFATLGLATIADTPRLGLGHACACKRN
eukprot:8023450-Alexandrium_andersonii.AAC.1